MHLLTMAHRGEARAFFEFFNLKQIAEETQIWKSENFYLLLTGEGIYESLYLLTSILNQYPEISHVYNLGVAGSLTPYLESMELISGRTSYFHTGEKAEFKSFPLHSGPNLKSVDILSCSKRILDNHERQRLSPFAECVDREAWGIAFACSKLKTPLTVIKVISDGPTSTDQLNICESVKEKAFQYSEALYNYYIKNIQVNPISTKEENINNLNLPLLENPNYYFTSAMRRQLNGLTSKAKLLNISTDVETCEEDFEENFTPKERAQQYLKNLNDEINPLRKEVQQNLDQLTSHLKVSGWKVKNDPLLEDEWLAVSAQIKSQGQLFKLSKTLEHFPFEEWENVFNQTGLQDDQ